MEAVARRPLVALRGGAAPSTSPQRFRYALWMSHLCRGYGLYDLARSYEMEADIFLPLEARQANLTQCKNR